MTWFLQGQLGFVPKHFLTRELLVLEDAHGYRMIDSVTSVGDLALIPTEILTCEFISLPNRRHSSVLSLAAANPSFTLIPHAEITPEALTLADENGSTAIHGLAETKGCLGRSATILDLRKRSYACRRFLGITPLHHAARGSQLQLLNQDEFGPNISAQPMHESYAIARGCGIGEWNSCPQPLLPFISLLLRGSRTKYTFVFGCSQWLTHFLPNCELPDPFRLHQERGLVGISILSRSG